MYELLRDTALKYPDKTAIDYMGAEIPFKKFLSMVDRCAASFTAYGIKPGDCVLLSMPNIPNAIILFYALNKIGARVAMTHPLYSSSELAQYMKETDSIWCVTVDMFYDRFKDILRPDQKLLITKISDFLPGSKKVAFNITKVLKQDPRRRQGCVLEGFPEEIRGAAPPTSGKSTPRKARSCCFPAARRTCPRAYCYHPIILTRCRPSSPPSPSSRRTTASSRSSRSSMGLAWGSACIRSCATAERFSWSPSSARRSTLTACEAQADFYRGRTDYVRGDAAR